MREEEKRKRDEAQKKKEAEDESRKRRAAEAFSKFFVPKKKIEQTTLADVETSKDIAEVGESSGAVKSNFMQFQVRERMKVAPCVRLQINKDQLEVLDGSLKTAKPLNELYLNELKSGLHKPGFSTNTWPTADKDEDDDVILTGNLLDALSAEGFYHCFHISDELEGVGEDIQTDESEKKTKLRTKYLMFDENRRPAYHGTWSKKSSNITARRPLAQDQVNYTLMVPVAPLQRILFTRNSSTMKLNPTMSGKKRNLANLSTGATAKKKRRLRRKTTRWTMTFSCLTVI